MGLLGPYTVFHTDGSAVIFTPTGHVLQLNTTAGEIWQEMLKQKSMRLAVETVADSFGIDTTIVKNDFQETYELLMLYGAWPDIHGRSRRRRKHDRRNGILAGSGATLMALQNFGDHRPRRGAARHI